MHTSIRFKLFIYMTVTILLFAILSFGSNTLFAEKYYTYNKKKVLIESSEKLSRLISGKQTTKDFDEENLQRDINILEKEIGGTIEIGNDKGEVLYPMGIEPGKPLKNHIAAFNGSKPLDKKFDKWEQYNENSFFSITKDPNLDIDTLRFQTRQDNGVICLLWVPMAGISDSVALSNNFTIIVGLITILITSLWAILISGRFTKPIKEINKITKQMAKLDFTKSLTINSSDELGELSESINQLSLSLDDAINELNDKNEKLEKDINYERQLDKMRKEFVSNVSHELKTPIFLIQGYAEGLKTNIAEGEEKRNFYCDVIMEESEKMNVLVRDLLDLSRMESGMLKVEKTQFDIAQLIETVLSKYEQILKENQIQLITEIAGGLTVYADRVRAEQIIVNFMNNAINYTDENKTVKIVLEQQPKVIRLIVFNSGKQIPEEELDKIWTSFYRVDKARTREEGGSGLGLSIVRAIQEAHHSAYGVKNVTGGVAFWCDFLHEPASCDSEDCTSSKRK